jgi:CheY-like chemotaxis protein
VHHREPSLIADRVVTPDFRDVHLILGGEPPRDIHRACRYIKVKGGAGAAEMGPLRHGLEVVYGFSRFHLDSSHEAVAPVRGRQHKVRKYLHLPYFHRDRLVLADVHDDVVAAFQADLEQTDHTVVLELFPNRSHQYRTHVTSRRREYGGTTLYSASVGFQARLDGHVFCHENDAVISESASPADATTRTILIVDDDRSVADTFARMLKLEGFGVATALSAEAGLELADSVHPHAIILDMRMPITNGLQFLRLVRSKPHLVEIPVAIVTGDYFLPESIQHELKSLGASIRFKPLWLEDLIALAKTLVSA